MADRQLIKPDLDFVNELKKSGGETLKKCFQCATCSVVCNLSPDIKPFPRKEMIWAGWGLKDKLLGNPDVWLCHQCNDCSEYCPRGARPGDVLAAVRSYSIMNYSFPKIIGKALRSWKMLPFVLAIPVILLLALMGANGIFAKYSSLLQSSEPIVYKNFLPQLTLVDPLFIGASLFVMLSFAIGIKRFWNDMNNGIHGDATNQNSLVGSLIQTLMSIGTHSQFKDCDKNRSRFAGHMLIFYGFIALAAVTGIVFMGIYVLKYDKLIPPLDLMNPVKIVANIGAAILLLGTTIVILNRLGQDDSKSKSSYFDWIFVIMILLVTVTGILAEVLRLAKLPVAAYPTYFIHLVFVFYLIAYLPFSKFAHMVYRTTAMVFAKIKGREV